MSAQAALDEAIRAAGSASKLAAAIGITSQAISQWDAVPLSRVAAVSAATGISIQRLRPDVFPQDALADSDPSERGEAA